MEFFLLTLILLNFNVFLLIARLVKIKLIHFATLYFNTESVADVFFWYSLILSFFSFDKFLYQFFDFSFIAFFLFVKCLAYYKVITAHFYMLIGQFIKTIFFS